MGFNNETSKVGSTKIKSPIAPNINATLARREFLGVELPLDVPIDGCNPVFSSNAI